MSSKITAIDGNSQKLDGGAMFGNAPRALWSRWIEPDELGRIPLACRSLLIEFENKKVLCETGIGSFFEPKMAERFGVQNVGTHMLRNRLHELGHDHEEIDFVILSHLHFDHAGGLLPTYQEMANGNSELLFPKAQFIVGREAFDRAKNPHPRDRASFIPGLVEKLENSGRLIIVETPDQVIKGLEGKVQFSISNGHTPGQLHVIFQGENSKVFFAGDLVPGTHWVNLPITMGYDRFPEMLIEEKQRLYDTAVPEAWWIFYTHDSLICCSKVAKNEKGKFAPIEPQTELIGFHV